MKTLKTYGSKLIELCSNANRYILLAAPFIKAYVLEKIIQTIPDAVEITVITRWNVSEIAAGVSDLEVFDLLQARNNSKLLLLANLHAKYYRVDEKCFLGSANLTGAALGWSSFPNLELMVKLSYDLDELIDFEGKLKEQSFPATHEIRNSLKEELDNLVAEGDPTFQSLYDNKKELNENIWLPTCISPEYLYKIYKKEDLSKLLESVVSSGKHDLSYFYIIPGLSENNFIKYLTSLIKITPIFQEIFNRSDNAELTSDDIKKIIQGYLEAACDAKYDSNTYWQILRNWITYFFRDVFFLRPEKEVLERAREIPFT